MKQLIQFLVFFFLCVRLAIAEERYFPAQKEVSPAELIAELNQLASQISTSPVIAEEYSVFLKQQQLSAVQLPYLDYVKARMIFEAARDGGLWHLRWTVTDLPPDASSIWRQWSDYQGDFSVTANAECDELSALFAQLLYHLQVKNVGLFWPTSNHTVAVWTIEKKRIVVPTSQIFLDDQQTLGTKGFDPYQQKTIYEYRNLDADDDLRIPVALARYLLRQIEQNIGKSNAELQKMRNQQVRIVGGS